jgi:hypothetical protein
MEVRKKEGNPRLWKWETALNKGTPPRSPSLRNRRLLTVPTPASSRHPPGIQTRQGEGRQEQAAARTMLPGWMHAGPSMASAQGTPSLSRAGGSRLVSSRFRSRLLLRGAIGSQEKLQMVRTEGSDVALFRFVVSPLSNPCCRRRDSDLCGPGASSRPLSRLRSVGMRLKAANQTGTAMFKVGTKTSPSLLSAAGCLQGPVGALGNHGNQACGASVAARIGHRGEGQGCAKGCSGSRYHAVRICDSGAHDARLRLVSITRAASAPRARESFGVHLRQQ